MKRLIFALFLFALGCSESEHPTEILAKDGKDGINGVICPGDKPGTVEVIGENTVLTCEGEDPIFIPGNGLGDPDQASSTDEPSITGPKGDKGDKGDRGDQGEPGQNGKDGTLGGRPFKIYEDAGKCLWLEFTDNGERWKLRGPL